MLNTMTMLCSYLYFTPNVSIMYAITKAALKRNNKNLGKIYFHLVKKSNKQDGQFPTF